MTVSFCTMYMYIKCTICTFLYWNLQLKFNFVLFEFDSIAEYMYMLRVPCTCIHVHIIHCMSLYARVTLCTNCKRVLKSDCHCHS